MTPSESKLASELSVAVARIADLELALGLGSDNIGVAFNLPSQLSDLLGCLLSAPNVTPEMITLRLQIATDAKVVIHRLRNALKVWCDAHGIPPFEVQSRRGLGYWLDAADKEKIHAITSGVIAPAPTVVSAAA
jgi:hypothetical protein